MFVHSLNLQGEETFCCERERDKCNCHFSARSSRMDKLRTRHQFATAAGSVSICVWVSLSWLDSAARRVCRLYVLCNLTLFSS